jgi:hypothetical protein
MARCMKRSLLNMVWQEQGIESVKNIMGNNLSREYATVYEPIQLNRNSNQIKIYRRLQ